MSDLLQNYNGGTTDEYGTLLTIDRQMGSGVVEGLLVVANATPNMTVYVQPGSGAIPTGTYPSSYNYRFATDTALPGRAVTIGTAAASPRIDYIVAYVDKTVAGSTAGANVNNTNSVIKYADVQGTPAGSPSVPTVAQIQSTIGAANPYMILAQIAVGASVSTITNPNITDLRVFAADRNDAALGQQSYVDSGLVWTATSGLAASMTVGKAYINVGGTMVPANAAAIASNTFTASQDTYVYINVNGTIGYLPVSNNASSPTLPANSIWLAIVVTNGSAVTSINTGQIGAVAPIVSSRTLMVSDTSGQLIYPTANQRVIGYAEITSNQTTSNSSVTQIPGLSALAIIPANRRVRVTLMSGNLVNGTTNAYANAQICDGTVSAASNLVGATLQSPTGSNFANAVMLTRVVTLSAGLHTLNGGFYAIGGGTATFSASPQGSSERGPANLSVELV